MEKVNQMLDANIPLRSGTWNIEEVAKINQIMPQCITLKPIVYLVNLDANSFKRKANKWLPKINDWVASHGGGQIIPMSVDWEQGLWRLKSDEDAKKVRHSTTILCYNITAGLHNYDYESILSVVNIIYLRFCT